MMPPERPANPRKVWSFSPAVLGVLAAGFAVVVMTVGDYQSRPPFAEEANIGWHIAMGHGFRSPMDPSPTAPPSAWSAPLYPLVIATAYRLFGVTPASVTALMLLHAVFFGMLVVATERLGTRVFAARAPGLIAAGLLAAHPLFLFYMADFWDGLMSLTLFAWLTVAALWDPLESTCRHASLSIL